MSEFDRRGAGARQADGVARRSSTTSGVVERPSRPQRAAKPEAAVHQAGLQAVTRTGQHAGGARAERVCGKKPDGSSAGSAAARLGPAANALQVMADPKKEAGNQAAHARAGGRHPGGADDAAGRGRGRQGPGDVARGLPVRDGHRRQLHRAADGRPGRQPEVGRGRRAARPRPAGQLGKADPAAPAGQDRGSALSRLRPQGVHRGPGGTERRRRRRHRPAQARPRPPQPRHPGAQGVRHEHGRAIQRGHRQPRVRPAEALRPVRDLRRVRHAAPAEETK